VRSSPNFTMKNDREIKTPDAKLILRKFDSGDKQETQQFCTWCTLFLLGCFLFLCGRLWYLQIYKGTEFKELSQKNSIKYVRLQSYRGNILDRSGRLIAGVEPSFNIGVVLKDVHDVESLIGQLATLLDEPATDVRMRLVAAKNQPSYLPVIVKRDASWEEVARIEARLYRLPGVVVEVAPARQYPYGTVAPHLLGYLGEVSLEQLKSGNFPHAVPGDLVGKSGIELRFEKRLAGKSGYKMLEVDAKGRMIRVLKVQKPQPGQDVQLSINLDLQLAAEDALSGKSGALVALDPNTGQILAMASSPKFDPRIFARGLTQAEWKELNNPLLTPLVNKAIQGQYSPGSTFKVVMADAALQERVVNPYTTFFCNGSFKLGRRRFRCWKRGGHGQTPLYKALVQSCDVYFYNVGLKLGVDKISKYAFGYGLGKKTGIDLPGEKPGFVPTRQWKKRRFREPWQKGETLNYSIGQGFLLVTPLQLARMIAAVGNGGKLYKPEYILDEPPVLQARVPASSWTLKTIRRALIGVTEDKHGTARTCRIEGIKVAGKTGTAQVIKQLKRRESEKMAWRYQDHALFVAFAPADNPQIAVAVVIEHGGHGGSAAAPVAKAVIERWLKLRSPKPSTIIQRNL